MLQWSRDFTPRKSHASRGQPITGGFASMEPGFYTPEKVSIDLIAGSQRDASMEPGFYTPEKAAKSICPMPTRVASMEPGFYTPEKSISPWHSTRPIRASMEPGFYTPEKLLAGFALVSPSVSFNGAGILHPGKGNRRGR